MPVPQHEFNQINACAYCSHHIEWHTHTVQTAESKKTSLVACFYAGNRVGGKCKCHTFCNGFRPDADKGITCVECGRSVFDHESVKREIEYSIGYSQGHKIAQNPNGIIYQVVPTGLMICCRWTVYHFMRTHKDVSEKELRPGFAIKCVRCDNDSILEIIPHNFQLGPTWAWKKPKPVTTLVLPPD